MWCRISLIRKQLLKERDLTLDRAIDIGMANELSDRNNSELLSNVSDPKVDVHDVGIGRKFPKKDLKPDIQNCRNCAAAAMHLSRNPVQRLVRSAFIVTPAKSAVPQ